MPSPSSVARTMVSIFPVLGVALLPALARAATLTYPGPAPCDTTLNKCIKGATSGDRIEIATSAPIVEYLSFEKSITLTGTPNVVPTIGDPNAKLGGDTIDISVTGAAATEIALRGLKLAAGARFSTSGSGTGHRFTVTDCEFNYGAVSLDVRTPNSTIELRHNVVEALAYVGIHLRTSNAGGGIFTFAGNRITSAVATRSEEGIELIFDGTGTSTVDVASNVIHGVGGCNCGSPAGIYLSAGGSTTSTVNIAGNTIADNSAPAIMFVGVPSTAKVTTTIFNNILYGSNNGVDFPPKDAALTIANGYNIQYPAAVNSTQGYTWSGSNGTVDPVFVNAGNRNYRLNATSTLVNIGYGAAPGRSDLDADDRPRVAGGTVDIGAYEVGSSAAADLTLTGKSEPSAVARGGQVTYALHLVNSGPSPAAGATITLPLPVGAALVSTASTRGSCTGASPVRCELGTLRKNESADVAVVVTMAQPGTLQATATASSGTTDPKSADNLVTLSVDVTAVAADAGADDAGADGPGDDAPDAGAAGDGVADQSGGPDASDAPMTPESSDGGCAMGGAAGLHPLWLFAALGLTAALRRRRA